MYKHTHTLTDRLCKIMETALNFSECHIFSCDFLLVAKLIIFLLIYAYRAQANYLICDLQVLQTVTFFSPVDCLFSFNIILFLLLLYK